MSRGGLPRVGAPGAVISPPADQAVTAVHNPLGLSALELASGIVTGSDPNARPLPTGVFDPRVAFEEAVRAALERPPCLVNFSGGRDSSVVLAAAFHVARSEGLELPIPVTDRFPNDPTSDEAAWQELVIGHLGADDWEIRTYDDQFDIVGPLALEVLKQHGLLYPAQAFSNAPALRLARGGAFCTGQGGDDLFCWRWRRAADVLARRVRLTPRDALIVGLALSCRPIRRLALRSRRRVPLLWLKPAAQDALTSASVRDEADEPLRWSHWTQWLHAQRYLRVMRRGIRVLAGDEHVAVVEPFLDPRFLASLGATGDRFGFASRSDALEYLFSDLLPDAVLTRRSKADFTNVYWHRHSRAFAASWSGAGVDSSLVDADRLRLTWAESPPHAASQLLAQYIVLQGSSST